MYAGPKFQKGWKYSLIFMVVFQGLILFRSFFIFALVFFSLLILYLWQKLVRAKFYRKSTHYQQKKKFWIED